METYPSLDMGEDEGGVRAMKIPEKIIQTARHLIDLYGDHVEYLGMYGMAKVFYYHFADDITAGFFPVHLYKEGNVEELTGDVASNFLDSFFKKEREPHNPD